MGWTELTGDYQEVTSNFMPMGLAPVRRGDWVHLPVAPLRPLFAQWTAVATFPRSRTSAAA